MKQDNVNVVKRHTVNHFHIFKAAIALLNLVTTVVSMLQINQKPRTSESYYRVNQKNGTHKNFALQNCNISKQGSENCPVNLSNRSSHYVIKSSTKDDLNPQ